MVTSWEFLNDFKRHTKLQQTMAPPPGKGKQLSFNRTSSGTASLTSHPLASLILSFRNLIFAGFIYKSSLSLTSLPAPAQRLTFISGRGIDLSTPLISNGPRKPVHLHNAGPSGDGHCTYSSPHCTSQITFSKPTIFTTGCPTHHHTRNGLLSLSLPHSCCTLESQGALSLILFSPQDTGSATHQLALPHHHHPLAASL